MRIITKSENQKNEKSLKTHTNCQLLSLNSHHIKLILRLYPFLLMHFFAAICYYSPSRNPPALKCGQITTSTEVKTPVHLSIR